jgi:protein-disulfide isomerase
MTIFALLFTLKSLEFKEIRPQESILMKLRFCIMIGLFAIIVPFSCGFTPTPQSMHSTKPEALKPAPYKDLAVRFGNEKTATIKIVMYHSLNCGHCKEYLETTFPKIKERYIDTGKVYFEVRDFPIDRVALDAARLAWCRNDPQVYWKIAQVLHHSLDLKNNQGDWSQSTDWCSSIIDLLSQNGFTQDECQSCLKNEALEKAIVNHCYQIQKQYNLNYTPAFLIDDKLHGSTLEIEEIEKKIEEKDSQGKPAISG